MFADVKVSTGLVVVGVPSFVGLLSSSVCSSCCYDLVLIVLRALYAVPVLVLSPHLVVVGGGWRSMASYSRSQLAMPSVLLFVRFDRRSDTLGGPSVGSCGNVPVVACLSCVA